MTGFSSERIRVEPSCTEDTVRVLITFDVASQRAVLVRMVLGKEKYRKQVEDEILNASFTGHSNRKDQYVTGIVELQFPGKTTCCRRIINVYNTKIFAKQVSPVRKPGTRQLMGNVDARIVTKRSGELVEIESLRGISQHFEVVEKALSQSLFHGESAFKNGTCIRRTMRYVFN